MIALRERFNMKTTKQMFGIFALAISSTVRQKTFLAETSPIGSLRYPVGSNGFAVIATDPRSTILATTVPVFDAEMLLGCSSLKAMLPEFARWLNLDGDEISVTNVQKAVLLGAGTESAIVSRIQRAGQTVPNVAQYQHNAEPSPVA